MAEEEIEAGRPPIRTIRLRGRIQARTRRTCGISAKVRHLGAHVDEDVRQWLHERRGDTDQLINDMLRTLMESERTQAGP
jgi:hypothetical protein